MKETIIHHLAQIEASENVRVFFACESGSRAWGFPSRDSDYHVRFLYAHPVEWYLSLHERRDVIERPIHDSLDISGWDLKKALQLLRKGNAALMEWLGSPIIYQEKFTVADKMRALAITHYSPVAYHYHYLQMARGNFRTYLQGETIRVKKYFYVLRPLLAILWIEAEFGMVPTDFNIMVDALIREPELRTAIDTLILRKRNGDELDEEARIEPISAFIEREMNRLETVQLVSSYDAASWETWNTFFRQSLEELWQNGEPKLPEVFDAV